MQPAPSVSPPPSPVSKGTKQEKKKKNEWAHFPPELRAYIRAEYAKSERSPSVENLVKHLEEHGWRPQTTTKPPPASPTTHSPQLFPFDALPFADPTLALPLDKLTLDGGPNPPQTQQRSNDDRVIIWSILEDDSDSDNDLAATSQPKDDRGSEPPEAKSMKLITRNMSAQDMFDRLLYHGCVDLSSQMDLQQDNAILLAGGGFGDIWKGELYNGTEVAIKTWRSSAIEQSKYKTLKRATREIYHWSRMEHKNIHKLLGVILFKGRSLGMVSQWMGNGNLHEYIRKKPHVDRYEMCIQVASGLAYMHHEQMVHGDLKAINILVSSDGVAKLSDFDFSIIPELSLIFSETSNGRAGSTRWAAPEFFSENTPPRSKAADVYALGMTMLEIFTGDVPYPQCQKDFQVIIKVQTRVLPTRPSDRLKDDRQGNWMWELLNRCWSYEPDARPSVAEVVASVCHFVGEKGTVLTGFGSSQTFFLQLKTMSDQTFYELMKRILPGGGRAWERRVELGAQARPEPEDG